MVAGLLVLGGIFQLINQSQRVYKFQAESADAQQMVRAAMHIMVRDIRQAGRDPEGSAMDLSGVTGAPIPLATATDLTVMMDLPRDCGGGGDNSGAPPTDDTDAVNCPSTDTCTTASGSCLDGDADDILDKNNDGAVTTGDFGIRGENEWANGVVGDINPDEWVTYSYNATTLQLSRIVTQVDTSGNTTTFTEPLADFIDQGGADVFTYSPNATNPTSIEIYLRGRTAGPDPQSKQYGFFELRSQVFLQNM